MEQKLFNWNQLFGSNQLIQTKMYSDKTNVVYSTTGITFTIWGNEADFLGPQIFLMQKWRARESSASVWRMNRVFIEPKKKSNIFPSSEPSQGNEVRVSLASWLNRYCILYVHQDKITNAFATTKSTNLLQTKKLFLIWMQPCFSLFARCTPWKSCHDLNFSMESIFGRLKSSIAILW